MCMKYIFIVKQIHYDDKSINKNHLLICFLLHYIEVALLKNNFLCLNMSDK